MDNLKIEMKPLIKKDPSGKDVIAFRLKVDIIGGAVECEKVIKYLQDMGATITKNNAEG